MSRIRERGNKATELALARLLRTHGITGWRRQVRLQVTGDKWRVTGKARSLVASRGTRHPSLTVRPDFVFPKSRTAVFVDGCFWHGCPKHCNPMKWLKKSSMSANHPPSPKGRLRRTGRVFWRKKLAGNKRRDALVTRTLRRAGWRVLRIWEHELQQCGGRSSSLRSNAARNAERGISRLVRRIERTLNCRRRRYWAQRLRNSSRSVRDSASSSAIRRKTLRIISPTE